MIGSKNKDARLTEVGENVKTMLKTG